MELYIILVIAFLFLSIFKNNKYFLGIASIFLVFLAGYRDWSVGTDTDNYYNIFHGVIVGGDLEFLFSYISDLVYDIDKDFGHFLLIMSILTICPVFYVVCKKSSNYMFSIFVYISLFFYFNSFNIIRQSIAVSFCLLAFYFLELKKYRFFILSVFIGFLFHKAAILSLLVLPLIYFDLKRHWLIVISLSTYLLGLFGLFTKIVSLVGFFGDKYLAYTSLLAMREGGIFSRLLLNLFLVLIIYSAKKIDLWIVSFYLGVIVLNILSFSPELGRLSQIFLITQIILLPNFSSMTVLSNKVIPNAIIITYCLIVFTILLGSNSGEIVPYKSLFVL